MPKQLPWMLSIVFFTLIDSALGNEGQSGQSRRTVPDVGANGKTNAVEAEPGGAHPAVYSQWPFDAQEARKRQQETGKVVDQPVETTNSIGMKLTLIPPGEFMMGAPDDEAERQRDEGPAHRVRITKPFFLGTYTVTLGQFRQFVEATDYKTDAEQDGRGGWGYTGDDAKPFKQSQQYTWRQTGFTQTDDHPVVNVSWNDAAAFCEWLSQQESATYRLPTEAEWEYACRAGTATRFHHGDDAAGIVKLGNVADATMNQKFAAWMKVNEVDREKIGTAEHEDGYVFTAPVGRFQANAFGLHDMHGNVWEWCADWDDPRYYRNSPTDDPTGPTTGTARIRRGGSWLHSPTFSRSARRRRYAPDARNSPIGFRVALSVQNTAVEARHGKTNLAE